MDNTYIEMMRLLEKNGRSTHEELSKKLKLSRPAVHERVGKLESGKYIKGYKAVIDWQKLGQAIKAYIYVKTCGSCKNVALTIANLSLKDTYIEECHRMAGEWCIVAKIRTSTPQHIVKLIDRIKEIEGVTETYTSFVLETVSEDGYFENGDCVEREEACDGELSDV